MFESVGHDGLVKLILGVYMFATGSYVFTWLGFSKLSDKLDTTRNNHVKHLEDDVEQLKKEVAILKAQNERRDV